MTSCPSRSLVDRHFAADIAPSDERALRAHLPGCAVCRARYDRYLVLAELDRGVPAMQDRLARGLGLSRRRRAWSRAAGVALGLAAAVVALSLWLPGRRYVARGGAGADADQALYVYRIPPGGTPQPVVNGVIGNRDELAFAYLNRVGWHRLLVYAVDEAGRVYWYHPAWTDASADPVAVRIQAGIERFELAEAIAQPVPRGRLDIHAVFTDDVVSVQTIERGARPGRAAELVVPIQVTEQEPP